MSAYSHNGINLLATLGRGVALDRRLEFTSWLFSEFSRTLFTAYVQ